MTDSLRERVAQAMCGDIWRQASARVRQLWLEKAEAVIAAIPGVDVYAKAERAILDFDYRPSAIQARMYARAAIDSVFE